MKTGTIIRIKEEALSLYSSPVKSTKQRFVVVETNEGVVCLRLMLTDNKLDWRVINAMINTLVDTGKVITKFTIVEPDIPEYIMANYTK